MMFFRALVAGLLGALLLLQVQHLHGHMHEHVHHGVSQAPLMLVPPPMAAEPRPTVLPAPPRSMVLPGSEPASRIATITEDTVLVDIERSTIDQLLARSSLGSQARIVPSFRSGRPAGFKLYCVRKGGLFAAIGLQNGDTLEAINGTPAWDLEHTSQILSPSSPSFVDLSLTRQGKPLRVVVLVHGT